MKILIVSSNYFPEPLGIGLYSHDMAKMLTEKGNEVWVLTTFPYYPWWKTPKEMENYAVKYSMIDGVHVHRAELQLCRTNGTIGRIIFELRMWLELRRVATHFKEQNFSKVISFIPSLGAGLVAKAVSTQKGVPHYLVVQDITTTGVSESGMSFGAILRYLVMPIERRIIESASFVSVISKSMLESARKIAPSPATIIHLPNYDTKTEPPILGLTRQDFDLPSDKFVIIHAGSIAKKQNLQNLVALATKLKSTNVQFYLFGHGNAEQEILNASIGLDNFFIRPSVPEEKLMSLLKCADLLLVNERPTQISMALPSKLVSYFSSEVPVLAIVPKGGPTYRAVENIAFWAEAGDLEAAAQKILTILRSPKERATFAREARLYYEQHLTIDIGRKNYLNWLFGSNQI